MVSKREYYAFLDSQEHKVEVVEYETICLKCQ